MESKKRDSEYKKQNMAQNRKIDKILGEMYRQDQNGGVSYHEFKRMMKGHYPKPITVT